MKPLCASLSSRGKPDACFALPNLAAAPKPCRFPCFGSSASCRDGLRPCTRLGAVAAGIAGVKMAWQPHQSHGSQVSALLHPSLAAEGQAARLSPESRGLCCCPSSPRLLRLVLGALCVHPAGSWWGIPAPSSSLLQEQLPQTLGAAPLLAGFLEADRKSLAGRVKGTALARDGDRAGARRRGWRSSGCIWAGGSLTFMERNSEKSVVRFLQHDQP